MWRWLVPLSLLGVLGAAIAFVASPPGQRALRDAVVSRVGEYLGREVRIDGEFEIRVGRRIDLVATRVHVANPAWADRTDMLYAERVALGVDATSLFARSPTVIVDDVTIESLDLNLERRADGRANWQFERPDVHDESRWISALPVVVDRVEMPNAHIVVSGPRLERPLEFRFEQFGQQRTSGDMLEITGKGTANDADVRVAGRIGPFDALVAGRGVTASGNVQIGQIDLSITARVDSLERPVDSEADVQLHGPDAAYAAATLGVRNLGEGPLDLTLSISPAPDGAGVRGSVVGKIGEFELAGDGELSDPTTMGRFVIRCEISGPDVSLLGGLAGVDSLPAEPFHLTASLRRTGTLLEIDDATLHLPDSAFSVQGSIKRIDRFAGNDLVIHLSGDRMEKFRELLRIPGLATGPFEVSATLHPTNTGEDRLDLDVTTALATFSAQGALGAYPTYVETRLSVDAHGADFGPFARWIGLESGRRTPFSGAARVELLPQGVSLKAATLQVGGDTLNLDGVVATVAGGAGSDVQFRLQGRRLDALGAYVQWSGLPSQPYKMSGRVIRQNGRTRIDDGDLSVASNRLQMTGAFGDPPRWRNTALQFVLSGEDTVALQQMIGGVALPRGAFRAQGSLEYSPEQIDLRQVTLTAAGATASIAHASFPLRDPVGVRLSDFDITANGPDLQRLVPDLTRFDVAAQRFDLRARGTRRADKWSFDPFVVETPGGYLKLEGTLDAAPDYSATAANLQIRATNLAESGRFFGVDLPAEPLHLVAIVSGTPTAFRLDSMSGQLGRSDFDGRAALDLGAKPLIDLAVSSTFMDLDLLAPGTSDATTAMIVTDADRVIPPLALPSELLNSVNARISLQSEKTQFFGQTYDDLTLRGTLQDGRVSIDPLSFGGTDGELTARLSLDTQATPPTARLALDGDQIRLGVIPGLNATAAASRYTVGIDVAASGSDLRQMVATLNGTIRFEGAGGRVPNSRMNALSSDFLTELVRSLNPMVKRAPYTDVVCQAYLFQAKDGVLQTDPALVVRTSDMDIVSSGTVDLRNESIDFSFKTAARTGLGLSAGELLNQYVKVSGSLAKPRLTINPTGTLVYGGAAFATGGLSILATTLWDRLSRQKDPCAAAIAEARRRSGDRSR